MKKLKSILSSALLLGCLTIQAQDNSSEKKVKPAKQNKINVSNAVKKLKNGGAVIYIVKDRKMKTDSMKDKGLDAKANELEIERLKKQKVIVKGLYENFTFCPIYFVYQSDIEKVKTGVIEGNLLDTTLSRNAYLTFKHEYFMFLDYGDIYDEQGKVYCDTCKSDISGKTTLKHNAFIFKNIYLSQLSKPFPYYMTCHYPAKEIAIKVKKMNSKLNAFYNKVNQ